MPNFAQPELDRRSPALPFQQCPVEFNLPAEIDRLRRKTIWSGHNARTLVEYDNFRVVLIVLHINARMGQHRSSGRISIQALTGHIQITAAERAFHLRPGGLLTLDPGVTHDVEAFEESAFLLTMT